MLWELKKASKSWWFIDLLTACCCLIPWKLHRYPAGTTVNLYFKKSEVGENGPGKNSGED
jgi:hypothetical protein